MDPVPLTEHLVVRPVAGWGACAVVASALLAVTVWTLVRHPPAVSRARRSVLAGLRLAATVAVLLVLARPTVHWQGREQAPGAVAILLDASRSQAIRDLLVDGAPVSRAEAVREAFTAAPHAWRDLGRARPVRVYAFGDEVRSVDSLRVEPREPQTDLGAALRGGGGAPGVRTVLLVSDGQATRAAGETPTEVARGLAERGITVHTVRVGQTEPTGRVRDLAVRDLRAPSEVTAGNRPVVRVVAQALGLKDEVVTLALQVGGREVETRDLVPASHRETREVTFAPLLEEPGLVRLRVEARPAVDELVAANNAEETLVRVEPGGVRVVYLEGRLRPESKYLVRALAGDPDVRLERHLLVGPATAGAAPGLRAVAEVDVVILGDLPATALAPQTRARLAESARRGELGLLALGGLQALGAGGWDATAVADVLPVRLEAGGGALRGPVAFRPTDEGRGHPVLAGPEEAADAASCYEGLPALAGASRLAAPRPGAVVLGRTTDGEPLLVVREAAEARAAVLAVDTTWRWIFAPERPDAPAVHAALWRNLVHWLAGRDTDRERLWIATDRTTVRLSDPDRPPHVEVRAGAPGDAPPLVFLTGPEGQRPVMLSSAGSGAWRAVVRPASPGMYTLEATAKVQGRPQSARTGFALQEANSEMVDPLADEAALRAIAEAGGGTVRPLEALPQLLEQLGQAEAGDWAPVRRTVALAGGRTFLAAAVAVLAAEWLLRRAWGLK